MRGSCATSLSWSLPGNTRTPSLDPKNAALNLWAQYAAHDHDSSTERQHHRIRDGLEFAVQAASIALGALPVTALQLDWKVCHAADAAGDLPVLELVFERLRHELCGPLCVLHGWN